MSVGVFGEQPPPSRGPLSSWGVGVGASDVSITSGVMTARLLGSRGFRSRSPVPTPLWRLDAPGDPLIQFPKYP